MSYFHDAFLENISKSAVKTILELGSRDLIDAHSLQKHYGATVYSFECNPDCINACELHMQTFDPATKDKIRLIKNAVSLTDGDITFYPFDLNQYDNMGGVISFENRLHRQGKRRPRLWAPVPAERSGG